MEIISDATTGREMINVVITRREITSVIPKREIMGVGKHLVWCVKMADFIYIYFLGKLPRWDRLYLSMENAYKQQLLAVLRVDNRG